MRDRRSDRTSSRLSAEAEGRIKNVIDAARDRLRKKDRESCFVIDESDRGGAEIKKLDVDRCAELSINFALPILKSTVSEHWAVWKTRKSIDPLLDLILERLQTELKKRWGELNAEDQKVFENLCFPRITKALADERDQWLLRFLLQRNTTDALAGATDSARHTIESRQPGPDSGEPTAESRPTSASPSQVTARLEGPEMLPEEASPIVREWESYKTVNHAFADGRCERIPESFLREVISREEKIEAKDVTDLQIRVAAVHLCRRYGQFQMIPRDFRPADSVGREHHIPKPDAGFWKEREEEFRRHNTAENTHLAAEWFSGSDHWRLFAADRDGKSKESARVFKALAREAAKGFFETRRSDPALDWLDAVQTAVDLTTNERLFGKVLSGESVIGERRLAEELAAGDAIPRGGFVEFIRLEDAKHLTDWLNKHGISGELATVEKRMFWESEAVTIYNIFRASADWCLELRSRSPATKQAEQRIEIRRAGKQGSTSSPKGGVRAPKSQSATVGPSLPQLSLEAHRKDQERRKFAKRDLTEALENYFSTLASSREVEITKLAEIVGAYACEIYNSSAEGYLAIPSLDPEALFGMAGPLNVGLTLADVEKCLSALRARRPWKISSDPVVRRFDDGRELMALHYEHPWFRQEIGKIVARRVQDARKEYEEGMQSLPAANSTLRPGTRKTVLASSQRAAVKRPARRPDSDKLESTKASWDTIEISFLSDERVQIRNGTSSETRNYNELGFADGRTGKPNRAWVALRAMAEKNGIIRDGAKTGTAWPKVEKRMQEVRKVLRKHFGIAADPVPFVEGTGYRAYFKIGCSPSFHT